MDINIIKGILTKVLGYINGEQKTYDSKYDDNNGDIGSRMKTASVSAGEQVGEKFTKEQLLHMSIYLTSGKDSNHPEKKLYQHVRFAGFTPEQYLETVMLLKHNSSLIDLITAQDQKTISSLKRVQQSDTSTNVPFSAQKIEENIDEKSKSGKE